MATDAEKALPVRLPLSRATAEALRALKVHPRETWDEVLSRILAEREQVADAK